LFGFVLVCFQNAYQLFVSMFLCMYQLPTFSTVFRPLPKHSRSAKRVSSSNGDSKRQSSARLFEEIKYNEDGQPVLPVNITPSLKLLSLGTIGMAKFGFYISYAFVVRWDFAHM
jgi:hypothetical protein